MKIVSLFTHTSVGARLTTQTVTYCLRISNRDILNDNVRFVKRFFNFFPKDGS